MLKKLYVLEHIQCENLVVILIMLVGICPRGAKIFGAISLSPVVPAVCFGIARTHAEASQGFCYDNNSPEFLQNNPPICALNLKFLYGPHFLDGRQLLSYHHHNGSERCL